ncbi:ABC transporter ATP-binding protein [Kiritimatiellaeota bacterium B1221]|nr:ABC transporter ATP-binding protein [Kiritimatiellaeota bacterium B1221]
MKASSHKSNSPKFLEWSYQSQHPARTLWRWANCSLWNFIQIIITFFLKHSIMWITPLVTALLLDKVVQPESISNRKVLISVSILVLALLANVPLHTLFISKVSKVARNLERRLRQALVIRFQQLSIPYHDDSESGRLQAKVLRDVEQVHMVVQHTMEMGLAIVTTLLVTTSITLLSRPYMILVYLAMVPLVMTLRHIFKNRIRDENRAFRQRIEEMNSQVSQMINMIPVSRAHGIEEPATERVDQKLNQVNNQGQRLDRINALFASSNTVAFMIGNLILFLISCWFCMQGKLTVGEVILFEQLFKQILNSVSQALNLYPQMAKGMESVRSIGEVLECPDLEHNQGKSRVSSVKGRIQYQNLGYTYRGASTPALSNVNVDISAGECVAIVGPSGGGKSTLMQLTIGFRRASEGHILLDGQDMEAIDMRAWRRFISVVPQESVLFEGTIRENILFGLDTVDEVQFEEIMDAANLREFVDKLPEGLNTRIGESGARLSGGQRQRLAIARALVRDPKVIVLDEPTSALDVMSEKLVQEAIDRMIINRTTLIVAHRLSTIRNANRVIVLEDGKISEMGTYEELANKPDGAFKRMKELQA